jgi:hypothetical protein
MSATEIVRVGSPLPLVRSVKPAGGYAVEVVWAAGRRDGRRETIDLAPQILTFKIYKALRTDRALFETVHVAAGGAAIAWGDDAIDLSAVTLERLAEESTTNADFVAFLKRNALTFDAAAAQLGISRRLVAYFAKDRPVPRHIALACDGLEARRRSAKPARAAGR